MKPNKLPVIFKKKNFLLIELLVALALITLFTIPFIRNPLYFCRSQLFSLEKIECERISELTFLDIKLSFMKKQINLKNISKYEEEAEVIPLSSFYLDTFNKKEVKRSYKLYAKREKLSLSDRVYKLVYVKVYLKPKGAKESYEYKYKLVVKR